MTDPIAWPIQSEFLDCLTEAFTSPQWAHPEPPKLICHRTGNGQSIPQINPRTKVNECCGGLAWVRLVSFYPTTGDRQLSPASSLDNCFHMWAVSLQLGALRCWPHAGKYATCDNWATNAFLVDEDAAALRRAVKCCFTPTHQTEADGIGAIMGAWAAAGVDGQCVGGVLPVTVGPIPGGADCCEVTSP